MSFRERDGLSGRFSPATATGALAWLAAAFVAAPVAAETVTRIEADTKVMASDNPFLLDGDNNAAAAFQLTANPEIQWSLDPGTTFLLSGRGSYRRYLSKYGDFLTGRADATMTHRQNEFLSADMGLSFARDLPVDALTESIDFSVDSRAVRERFQAHSSIRWAPDTYTELTGRGSWERLRFPGGSLLLSSTEAYQFGLGVSRRVDPYTSLGLTAQARQTSSVGTGDTSASGLFITVAHRFASDLEASGQFGIEWTDYDLADSKRARVSGNGSICYRPALTDLCITASLQSEVSGLSGLQREFNAGFVMQRRLGTRDSVSAMAEFRRAELGALGLTTDALRVNTTYEHRLGRRLSFTSSVDYLSRKFLSAVRNNAIVVQIGVTFTGES